MKKRKSIVVWQEIERIEKNLSRLNLFVAQDFSSWDDAPPEFMTTKTALESNLVKLKKLYNRLKGYRNIEVVE